jgi:hypothetical protein
LGSTVFHAFFFAVIFGGLGAIGGARALLGGLARPDGFWPAWMRGAFVGLLIGQVVFAGLTLVFAGVSLARPKQAGPDAASVRSQLTLLPFLSGAAGYLSHGVEIAGSLTARTGLPGVQPVRQAYSLSLLRGIRRDGEAKDVPAWAFLLVAISAAAAAYGGHFARRTSAGGLSSVRLAASFAGAYALILAALVPFYTLAVATVRSGDTVQTATLKLGPSAAQAFAFGLVLAFVCGGVGIILGAGRARP